MGACGGKNTEAVYADDSNSQQGGSHHDYYARQSLSNQQDPQAPLSGGFAYQPNGYSNGLTPPPTLPYQQGVPTSSYAYSGGQRGY